MATGRPHRQTGEEQAVGALHLVFHRGSAHSQTNARHTALLSRIISERCTAPLMRCLVALRERIENGQRIENATDFGMRSSPFMGVTSIGQAEKITTQSIRASSTT